MMLLTKYLNTCRKHVVFGRVVSGQDVVMALEALPVDNNYRPLQQAVISNCGELVLHRTTKVKGNIYNIVIVHNIFIFKNYFKRYFIAMYTVSYLQVYPVLKSFGTMSYCLSHDHLVSYQWNTGRIGKWRGWLPVRG